MTKTQKDRWTSDTYAGALTWALIGLTVAIIVGIIVTVSIVGIKL